MKAAPVISHEATVQSVDSDSVTVSLSPGISCSGCQAERSCGMTDKSTRIIKVKGSFDLHAGDKVNVSIMKSQGYMALFLGYLLPLILVVATLIVFSVQHAGELASGLASIGILIPYYIILWIFRRFVGKKFSFNIKTAI